MLKNLPIIILILVVLYVLYTSELVQTVKGAIQGTVGGALNLVGQGEAPEVQAPHQGIDLGMYDVYNPNAFGTTAEADRRITNDGVRKEYHHNPFPWAECGDCRLNDCDKHGVPEPTIGHTHVCRNGFPSKRVVDMYGGHFQLNHICAGGVADGCHTEPSVLGRWWCRSCGANPESVGLNIRPACTRCN
jgi:hypothetical protein